MALTYLPGGAINYTLVDDPALNALITQAQAHHRQGRAEAARPSRPPRWCTTTSTTTCMYMQNLYVAHSDKWSGFVVKPSELLSVVDPQSLANVTKS